MTRRMQGMMVIGCLVVLAGATPAQASSPLRKLGRGAANVFTGWIELPAQIIAETETNGSWSALTVGVLKGAAFAVGRTLLGALEVATFPLVNFPNQVGSDPYGPLVEPEFAVFRRIDKP